MDELRVDHGPSVRRREGRPTVQGQDGARAVSAHDVERASRPRIERVGENHLRVLDDVAQSDRVPTVRSTDAYDDGVVLVVVLEVGERHLLRFELIAVLAAHDLDGDGIAFVVLGHSLEELAPLLALRLVPVWAHAITPSRSRSRFVGVAAIGSTTHGLLPARPGRRRPVRTAAPPRAGTVSRPQNARIRWERRTMAALQTIEAGT